MIVWWYNYIFDCSKWVFVIFSSDEVKEQGFTVVIDMRGSTWATVKPILKVLQEHFSSTVHVAYIIKPDNFWQKQRTSLASHKYKFEVSTSHFYLDGRELSSRLIKQSKHLHLNTDSASHSVSRWSGVSSLS